MHAAVIAINEAVDRGDVSETTVALRNPAALLVHLQEVLMSSYQEVLQEVRRRKAEGAAGKVSSDWSPSCQTVVVYCLFVSGGRFRGHV